MPLISSRFAAASALIATALVAAGCGGGGGQASETTTTTGGGAAKGNPTEKAFLQAMVPHHRSAVSMAEVAARRGQAPEIKMLAQGITSSQLPEIRQMEKMYERLFDAPLEPDENAHSQLGLTPEEAGMGHGDVARMLEGANPFDRAFVDEMIPHHEGAIRMAKAVLPKTKDPQLRRLAQMIITAQEREVRDMRSFRAKRYGSSEPPSQPMDKPQEGEDRGGGHQG